MSINTVGIMIFVAAVATIVLTILAYKHIVPEKKRPGLNKLGQFLSDVFNFKFLIIEKILQFLYVLSTIACVCFGLSMLFGISIYHSSFSNTTYTDWYGIYGILIAVLGPIAIRLVFEGLIMGVLLIKNVIQINKKLKDQVEEEEYRLPSMKDLIDKENFDFIKKNNAKNEEKPE